MSQSTISFAGYTFNSEKGCFACEHVLGGEPVRLFVHDVDGDLQFLCGSPDHDWNNSRPRFIHAAHLLEWHPDLLTLRTVDFGFEAEREDTKSPWVVSPIPPYK